MSKQGAPPVSQYKYSASAPPNEDDFPPSYDESMKQESAQVNQSASYGAAANLMHAPSGYTYTDNQKPPTPYSNLPSQGNVYQSPYPKQVYQVQPPQQQQAPYLYQSQGGIIHSQNQHAPTVITNIRPGQQVYVHHGFDSGARFDHASPPSIPPPPPGIAPNYAQLAAQSGAVVVTSKKKSDFLMGPKGAGWTFW